MHRLYPPFPKTFASSRQHWYRELVNDLLASPVLVLLQRYSACFASPLNPRTLERRRQPLVPSSKSFPQNLRGMCQPLHSSYLEGRGKAGTVLGRNLDVEQYLLQVAAGPDESDEAKNKVTLLINAPFHSIILNILNKLCLKVYFIHQMGSGIRRRS